MSSWRVSQHYGFGAARIPICPEAHRAARSSFREGLADVQNEFADGGSLAMARRILGQSPAILLGLLIASTFLVTMMRDYSDRSAIDVVLLESLSAEPEALPEPMPEPEPLEVAKVEPPPPPVEKVAPPPPQPVETLVQKPPPPPKARPVPPKPPAMPQVAKLERPKPPPARADRSRRPPPTEKAKQRVRMDSVAPRPVPRSAPEPARTQRVAVAKQNKSLTPPRLSAPAAPKVDLPKQNTRPDRFRVAAPTKSNAPRRPIAVAGLAPAAPTERAAAPTPRARAARAPAERATPRVVPGLASAPKASSIVNASLPTRSSRRDDRPPPPSSRRSSARPAAQMAKAPSSLAAPSATTAARVARAAVPSTGSPKGSSSARPGLAGVPLGDLAVCVSDREEDRLKQAVVAAVTTQKECVSHAGTYRFVETKNLNSFLMWIDRSAGRAVGDRCDELRHALACLQNSGLRAGR